MPKMSALFVSVVLGSLVFSGCQDDSNGQSDQDPSYLYVQTARSGTYDGSVFTFSDVSDYTIIFSDRPFRIANHLDNAEYLALWAPDAPASFSVSPPNAAISFYNENGIPSVVVVELNDFKLNGTSFSYRVRILEGQIPPTTQEITLFIDCGTTYGDPLAHATACGVVGVGTAG